MIKKIGKELNEGDIVEIMGWSEPLYLFHHGKLIELTPQEQGVIWNVMPEKRGTVLSDFRLRMIVG